MGDRTRPLSLKPPRKVSTDRSTVSETSVGSFKAQSGSMALPRRPLLTSRLLVSTLNESPQVQDQAPTLHESPRRPLSTSRLQSRGAGLKGDRTRPLSLKPPRKVSKRSQVQWPPRLTRPLSLRLPWEVSKLSQVLWLSPGVHSSRVATR
mgnify:CR=1 FL=1